VEGEVGGPDFSFNAKDEFRFYVEGSPDYVKSNVQLLNRDYPQARVSTNIKNKTVRVRESDGIEVAFKKFVTSFKGKNAVPSEVLLEKAAKLIYEAQHR
jgi:hypothetical protein